MTDSADFCPANAVLSVRRKTLLDKRKDTRTSEFPVSFVIMIMFLMCFNLNQLSSLL